MTVRRLLTVTEGRDALRDRAAAVPSDNDAAIGQVIDAVTPVIEDVVGIVVESTVVDTFGGWRSSVLLHERPTSITSVVAGGTTLTNPGGYTVDLSAGIVRATAGSFGADFVVVTYMAGYAEADIPANIKLAAIEQFRFAWQQTRQGQRPRQLMPGGAPGDGSYTPSGYLVPNIVMAWLKPNPRLPGFA